MEILPKRVEVKTLGEKISELLSSVEKANDC
jgi:hypothetical protein